MIAIHTIVYFYAQRSLEHQVSDISYSNPWSD